MPGQGRLGDKARSPIDAHGCPACPHPVVGPSVVGSGDVVVNGRPALRVDDTGIHGACCGPNVWLAITGSLTVQINGKAAFRLGDTSRHCSQASGALIEASSNVVVDGPDPPTPTADPEAHTQAELDAIKDDLAAYGVTIDDGDGVWKSLDDKYTVYKAIQDGVHQTAKSLGGIDNFKQFAGPVTFKMFANRVDDYDKKATPADRAAMRTNGQTIEIYKSGLGMVFGNNQGGKTGAPITKYNVSHELCHVMLNRHTDGTGQLLDKNPTINYWGKPIWEYPFYPKDGEGDRSRGEVPSGMNNWTQNSDPYLAESSAEVLNLWLWTGTGDPSVGLILGNNQGADMDSLVRKTLAGWDPKDPLPAPGA